jgi:hypothetical protein
MTMPTREADGWGPVAADEPPALSEQEERAYQEWVAATAAYAREHAEEMGLLLDVEAPAAPRGDQVDDGDGWF